MDILNMYFNRLAGVCQGLSSLEHGKNRIGKDVNRLRLVLILTNSDIKPIDGQIQDGPSICELINQSEFFFRAAIRHGRLFNAKETNL